MSEDSTPENAGTTPTEPDLASTAPVKKKPLISLPFAIVAVVILGVGALYGQKIMEWVMLQQEAAKAASGPQEPEEYAGLSQLAKDLQAGGGSGDPAAAFGAAGSVPPEGGGRGGRPPAADEPAEDGDATDDDESKASEEAAEVAAEEKTESSEPAGRGGRMSPEERFAQQDKDGDGKLSGDEIPGPMKERMEMLDTDSDGSISKEELLSAMEKMRSSRGGGGGMTAGENQ